MPRRRTKQRPVLGAVSVNNVSPVGADVGVISGGKQPSSSGVASSVEKKSKSSTTTSEPAAEKSSPVATSTAAKPPSPPSPYTVISCLENIVHYATKRSPGGRGILLNDISTEYRKLYGQDLPSIQKTFVDQTSLSAVLRECCSQNVTVVNGRAVWVEDKENAEEEEAKDSKMEGKVENDNAAVPITTANIGNNDQDESEDDDADDEDYNPIEDASIEENDLTFVTADDFIDEAALFAEEEEEDDEDFDPVKDSTIQKDDLNLRAADGFIDEAILFADDKDNEVDDDDADDEDFDPVKDSTVQKDDLNLKASDGFIDEAILHAEEKEQSKSEVAKMASSSTADETFNDTANHVTPTREILLNRIESIVMLATIEDGSILLKDIAPLYFQEFRKGIPVKKCFGSYQNLRKVLAKWSPCISIDTDGRASWVEKKSEPATLEEKPTGDPEDDDEDYDPGQDSSATSADLDLHNPDGFFDASAKALKKEVDALTDDSPPHLSRDVLLNRIKCIVEEATAASPTGIKMANIAPVYKTKYGDNLSTKESFGIKLKDVLIQFFPEVEIIGNSAVWVEPDGYNSEEDEDFDPNTDSTIEDGDMDLIVADGVVINEAELVLQRIESIVEDAGPKGLQIPQIRAKYEKMHGPLSCRRTFGPHLSLKWALATKRKSIKVSKGKSPRAIWRAAASAAVAKVSAEKEPAFSNAENSVEEEMATSVVAEVMPLPAEDLAQVMGASEELIENPYSSQEDDKEHEPICAMCIVM